MFFYRYDGRGHLHDLSEYDSGSWNTSYQLSEEEERIEALCDEERYLALTSDLLEEEARQGGSLLLELLLQIPQLYDWLRLMGSLWPRPLAILNLGNG